MAGLIGQRDLLARRFVRPTENVRCTDGSAERSLTPTRRRQPIRTERPRTPEPLKHFVEATAAQQLTAS